MARAQPPELQHFAFSLNKLSSRNSHDCAMARIPLLWEGTRQDNPKYIDLDLKVQSIPDQSPSPGPSAPSALVANKQSRRTAIPRARSDCGASGVISNDAG